MKGTHFVKLRMVAGTANQGGITNFEHFLDKISSG